MKAPWLISARFDLLTFGLPAALALALVPLEPWLAPGGQTPLPAWVVTVLLVDVAHVWATLYRTYLDPAELGRRRGLYLGVPIGGYLAGVMVAAWSWAVFWTALAYAAVFHFVRQQYGWVALYNRRDPGLGRLERFFDGAAIYASTLFPLVWWHAHLPRDFHWFLPGDFLAGWIDARWVAALAPAYVVSLLGFFALQMRRARWDGPRWGKLLVVSSTAACWGVGIIATNSDWAFTVTNVLIHGVPYVAVVWVQERRDIERYPRSAWQRRLFTSGKGFVPFFGLLAALAYIEEWVWDRTIWHGDTGLFIGPAVDPGSEGWVWVMPLLAVPQLTHYVLDGFIWRRGFRPRNRSATGDLAFEPVTAK